MGIRAQVKQGRLIVDEPTGLPEGTVLDLVVADEGDDLDTIEREELHEAITEGWAQAEAGDVSSAEEVLSDLKKLR